MLNGMKSMGFLASVGENQLQLAYTSPAPCHVRLVSAAAHGERIIKVSRRERRLLK